MNNPQNLVDIEAHIVHETDKAWLLCDEFGCEAWVPKSQVEDNDDGTFTMPMWLADDKGFGY